MILSCVYDPNSHLINLKLIFVFIPFIFELFLILEFRF